MALLCDDLELKRISYGYCTDQFDECVNVLEFSEDSRADSARGMWGTFEMVNASSLDDNRPVSDEHTRTTISRVRGHLNGA
jgi:hypothetical protein